MMTRRLVPVPPSPPYVRHHRRTSDGAATGGVRHCYGSAPMGSDPHGSTTVAVPERCRTCELRGMGMRGTTGRWRAGGQAPPAASLSQMWAQRQLPVEGNTRFWPARKDDLVLCVGRPSGLCGWEPPLTLCCRPRASRPKWSLASRLLATPYGSQRSRSSRLLFPISTCPSENPTA